jgi:hypothetical protein
MRFIVKLIEEVKLVLIDVIENGKIICNVGRYILLCYISTCEIGEFVHPLQLSFDHLHKI